LTITLEQLYEMQKKLDARIIVEKGLEGVDLLPNTVLALQVEIGYLANLWRGFKHWSNDRAPRTRLKHCLGCGTIEEPEVCPICGNENPLLNKYADCLHFFLSIARQLDLPAKDLYSPGPDEELMGGTSKVFTEIIYHVGTVGLKKDSFFQKTALRLGLWIFYSLGEQRLGFTFEEIAAAYVAKNEVN